MPRSRQRRKERQAAANESQREAGVVAVELREEADQGLQPPVVRGGEESDEEVLQREASERREDGAAELIEALGVLRESRANPLTAGITVFTAMLEQARAGYAADRLAELEAALSLDFNALEAQGIVQIAMANMDETGVPDVEHGVQLCIEARVEVAASEPVAEDHGDGEESQVDGATEQDRIDEVREAEQRDREDHNAEVEQEDDAEQAEIEREEAEADKPGPED